MSDPRAEKLREQSRETLAALLAEAVSLYDEAVVSVASSNEITDKWQELYNRMELASAAFPFSPYHNYYYIHLNKRREPLFGGIYDGLSENYVDIGDATVEDLRQQFLVPVHELQSLLFDRAKAFFRKAASEALIVRRLSGYGDLLEQLGAALKLPWVALEDPSWKRYQVRAPYWVGQMTTAIPPHRNLMSLIEANVGTIRILHDRLQNTVPVLTAMLKELEYADMLKEPVPVPHTLITVTSNTNNSTIIGDGATVRDSAVGPSSARTR